MRRNKPEPLKGKVTCIFDLLEYSSVGTLPIIGEEKIVFLRDVKSACEFYLRYKDNPRLFVKRFPELKKEVEKIVPIEPNEEEKRLVEKGIIPPKTMDLILKVKAALYRDAFNEWLFKFAFKDVFEEYGKKNRKR